MTIPVPPAAALMCRRDAQGRVVDLTRQVLSSESIELGAWQAVSAADPEVTAFLNQAATQADVLSQTDIGLARVLEDVIEVLINRRLLQFTDLPQAAQDKLLERRETRASLSNRLELLPFADENDNGLI